MKIGYYFEAISIDAGGIYTYSVSILRLIVKSKIVSKIYLFLSEKNYQKLYNEFSNCDKIKFVVINFKNDRFKRILLQLSNTFFYLSDLNPRFSFLKYFAVFINPLVHYLDRYKLDLIHLPFFTSPFYGTKTPIIVTAHDLQELHLPKLFDATQRMKRAIVHKRAIENSNHIIVSFEHVKKDILDYFKIESEKVSVCQIPMSNEWNKNVKPTKKQTLYKKI